MSGLRGVITTSYNDAGRTSERETERLDRDDMHDVRRSVFKTGVNDL